MVAAWLLYASSPPLLLTFLTYVNAALYISELFTHYLPTDYPSVLCE